MKLPLIAIALVFTGCGSSASSSQSSEPPSSLTITPASGSPPFSSPCVTYANMFGPKLNIFCNESVPGRQQTRAAIVINAFHGTDSYRLASPDDGTVQFIDTADVEFGVAVTQAGIPSTNCILDVAGPPSPRSGDTVSGKFHCENLSGAHLFGDGSYQPPVRETVDGTFDATIR